MIPCVFLTYDDCRIETVHTVNAYSGVKNIEFLIPFNDGAARDFYARRLRPGIAHQPVRTDKPITATLKTLLDACQDHEWIFWATADRYPYTREGLAQADRIAQALLVPQPCLEHVDSIRLTQWKDAESTPADAFSFAGTEFRSTPPSRHGHWHHQFIRRALLEQAVAMTPPEGGLMDFHAQLGPAFRRLGESAGDGETQRSYLIPEAPLLKFEEPTLNGLYTTNFFMRRLHEGQCLDVSRLSRESSSFASETQSRARNAGWPQDHQELVKSLCQPAPATRFQVVSPGGVGSKMICRWLEPDGDTALWSKMHSHRRLPPLPAFDGQRFVYVIGDPRNTVLSLFNRRHGRTELHGFTPRAGRDQQADDFVQRHALNMQVDASSIDPSWDLQTYLENGADLLRLEEHFDNWFHGSQRYGVVFLHYEMFADSWPALAAELGLPAIAPELKARGSDWRQLDPTLRRGLNAMYGAFARRLSEMPALTVRGRNRRHKPSPALENKLRALLGN